MKRSLKEAAKKHDKETCTILAKEIIRARKAITKIYTSKAHLNSVQLQMKNQLGWHLCFLIYLHNTTNIIRFRNLVYGLYCIALYGLYSIIIILATLRVAGSLAKSTEVMQAMQRLVRVPEVAQTMQDMSKEMMKAGIIEEMLDETFEDMEDQEELEDAAQVEVCNSIYSQYL